MRTRQLLPEIMDEPDIDLTAHISALRGLGRINRFSRSVAAVWKPIEQAAREAGRPIRVLDIASGGGDLARGLARKARTSHLPIEVHGADLSTQAIAFASAQAAEQGLDMHFFPLDALRDTIPDDYDILTTTLFLHHLTEADATRLLARMNAAARKMLLVDDLIRSRAGYALAWAGCRLLSRSKVVHHDGPVSVAGAFTVEEVRAMAQAAGLKGVTIQRHWPERFLLTWTRA